MKPFFKSCFKSEKISLFSSLKIVAHMFTQVYLSVLEIILAAYSWLKSKTYLSKVVGNCRHAAI